MVEPFPGQTEPPSTATLLESDAGAAVFAVKLPSDINGTVSLRCGLASNEDAPELDVEVVGGVAAMDCGPVASGPYLTGLRYSGGGSAVGDFPNQVYVPTGPWANSLKVFPFDGVGVEEAPAGSYAPGQEFTVSLVDGQPSTDYEVWVESDPTLLATFTTNSGGAGTATVTLPAGLADGPHQLKVLRKSDSAVIKVLDIIVSHLAQIQDPVAVPVAGGEGPGGGEPGGEEPGDGLFGSLEGLLGSLEGVFS